MQEQTDILEKRTQEHMKEFDLDFDEARKKGKDITKEAVEGVLAGKEQKKPQSVSVKLPMELYEKYFAQMDGGAVQEIMEKALEGYFGKGAAGV